MGQWKGNTLIKNPLQIQTRRKNTTQKKEKKRKTKQVIKNKIGNTKIRNKKEKIQQENEKTNQYSIKISIKDSQIAANIPTVNQTVSRN